MSLKSMRFSDFSIDDFWTVYYLSDSFCYIFYCKIWTYKIRQWKLLQNAPLGELWQTWKITTNWRISERRNCILFVQFQLEFIAIIEFSATFPFCTSLVTICSVPQEKELEHKMFVFTNTKSNCQFHYSDLLLTMGFLQFSKSTLFTSLLHGGDKMILVININITFSGVKRWMRALIFVSNVRTNFWKAEMIWHMNWG